MRHGPLAHAALLGGFVQREIPAPLADDFHFIEMQEFPAWKLDTHEASFSVGQFHHERRAIGHPVAVEDLAVVMIDFAPCLAVIGEEKEKLRGALGGSLGVGAVPQPHLRERLRLAKVHLPPRVGVLPRVEAPLAVRHAVAAAHRVVAGGWLGGALRLGLQLRFEQPFLFEKLRPCARVVRRGRGESS